MKQNAGILFHAGDAMPMSPRGAHDARGRRKYLSRDEGRRFLAQARLLPPARALFCETIYYTGCRISEALELRSIDIDPELHVLHFRSLKKRQRVEIRRVPVPESLTRQLFALASLDEEQPLWQFSRTTGWRIIKWVMAKAKVSGIHATTKGLRHGFGLRCALAQIPLHRIQTWMGHADSATTAIYLDVMDEEERQLIEKTW
jgi:integrase